MHTLQSRSEAVCAPTLFCCCRFIFPGQTTSSSTSEDWKTQKIIPAFLWKAIAFQHFSCTVPNVLISISHWGVAIYLLAIKKLFVDNIPHHFLLTGYIFAIDPFSTKQKDFHVKHRPIIKCGSWGIAGRVNLLLKTFQNERRELVWPEAWLWNLLMLRPVLTTPGLLL